MLTSNVSHVERLHRISFWKKKRIGVINVLTRIELNVFELRLYTMMCGGDLIVLDLMFEMQQHMFAGHLLELTHQQL